MRKASPRLAAVARRVLSSTPREEAACDISVDALKQSCEALRPRLTELVGREGFRALLSRALALAKAEFPCLDGIQLDDAATLTGLDEVMPAQELAEREAGCAAVLAHFLGLLTAFIGTELTRQVVERTWPDTPVTDADFGTEDGKP